MITKLTLSMDEEIIRKAKKLAKEEQKSLSAMISELLEHEINKEKKFEALQRFEKLRGSLIIEEPSEFKDELDRARWEHLKKKHGF